MSMLMHDLSSNFARVRNAVDDDVKVEDDKSHNHELKDDHDLQSRFSSHFLFSHSQIQSDHVDDIVGEDVHPGCEPDAETQDEVDQSAVAGALVADDAFLFSLMFEDGVDELLEVDAQDLDLEILNDDVLGVPKGHYQSGMHWTLIATHHRRGS